MTQTMMAQANAGDDPQSYRERAARYLTESEALADLLAGSALTVGSPGWRAASSRLGVALKLAQTYARLAALVEPAPTVPFCQRCVTFAEAGGAL